MASLQLQKASMRMIHRNQLDIRLKELLSSSRGRQLNLSAVAGFGKSTSVVLHIAEFAHNASRAPVLCVQHKDEHAKRLASSVANMNVEQGVIKDKIGFVSMDTGEEEFKGKLLVYTTYEWFNHVNIKTLEQFSIIIFDDVHAQTLNQEIAYLKWSTSMKLPGVLMTSHPASGAFDKPLVPAIPEFRPAARTWDIVHEYSQWIERPSTEDHDYLGWLKEKLTAIFNANINSRILIVFTSKRLQLLFVSQIGKSYASESELYNADRDSALPPVAGRMLAYCMTDFTSRIAIPQIDHIICPNLRTIMTLDPQVSKEVPTEASLSRCDLDFLAGYLGINGGTVHYYLREADLVSIIPTHGAIFLRGGCCEYFLQVIRLLSSRSPVYTNSFLPLLRHSVEPHVARRVMRQLGALGLAEIKNGHMEVTIRGQNTVAFLEHGVSWHNSIYLAIMFEENIHTESTYLPLLMALIAEPIVYLKRTGNEPDDRALTHDERNALGYEIIPYEDPCYPLLVGDHYIQLLTLAKFYSKLNPGNKDPDGWVLDVEAAKRARRLAGRICKALQRQEPSDISVILYQEVHDVHLVRYVPTTGLLGSFVSNLVVITFDDSRPLVAPFYGTDICSNQFVEIDPKSLLDLAWHARNGKQRGESYMYIIYETIRRMPNDAYQVSNCTLVDLKVMEEMMEEWQVEDLSTWLRSKFY